jgi:hypothetical protein
VEGWRIFFARAARARARRARAATPFTSGAGKTPQQQPARIMKNEGRVFD